MNSTNIDHLAKIGEWLKTMGLPRWVLTHKEVENKKNHFKHISDADFLHAKIKLK